MTIINSAEHLSLNSRTIEWTIGCAPLKQLAFPIKDLTLLPKVPSTQGMQCGCTLGSCFEWHDTHTFDGFMCAVKWHAPEGL